MWRSSCQGARVLVEEGAGRSCGFAPSDGMCRKIQRKAPAFPRQLQGWKSSGGESGGNKGEGGWEGFWVGVKSPEEDEKENKTHDGARERDGVDLFLAVCARQVREDDTRPSQPSSVPAGLTFLASKTQLSHPTDLADGWG